MSNREKRREGGERERTRETDFMWMRNIWADAGETGEKSVGEMVVVLLEKDEGEKKKKKEAKKGDQRVQDGAGTTFRGEDEGTTGELI